MHYIVTPEGRIKVLRPGTREYPLRRGMRFYHGTAQSHTFRQLQPTSFVARTRREARRFARGWLHRFGKGKVLNYELVALPTLIEFRDPRWETRNIRGGLPGSERSRKLSPRAMRQGRETSLRQRARLKELTRSKVPQGAAYNPIVAPRFCQMGLPVDGWIASYPRELLLCEPRKFLKYGGISDSNVRGVW